MSKKSIGYVFLVIIAFVIGTQTHANINFKSSQVFTSDDIAVINNDQKVNYLDSDYKFGDTYLTQIGNMESDYNYQTTNSAEADQGMVSGKYAATITIPSNFTKGLLSINSENPSPTTITYALNSKLPSGKSNSIETEIVNSIDNFENNLTYMYIYSIFDGLHTTQEGVETVAENSQPVYTFLDEISEIDIVGNHEYELEDNNSDNFDSIDISKQLAAFSATVSSYKQDVANVIEVYKKQDEIYNNDVDEAIGVMNDNNELLNDRISNVEDTLADQVDSNEQFTAGEFSITDADTNITTIIKDYIDQLKTVNNTVDDNNLLIADSDTIDQALDILSENSHYKWLVDMLSKRVTYYKSLDSINDKCLTKSGEDASTCVTKHLAGYKSKFGKYDGFISKFRQEEDYYDTMTYYLEQVADGNIAKEAEAEAEPVSFDVPIESSEVTEETAFTPNPEAVELTATSYGQNLSATTDSSNNLVVLQISNLTNISKLTIDTSASSNVKSITPLEQKLDNAVLDVDGNTIELSKINSTQLNLVFNVEKRIDRSDATATFTVGEQSASVTIGEKNPLTVNPTIDGDKLTLDYQYIYQAADEKVDYQNSGLAADYGTDGFSLTDDGSGAVSLDKANNGFTIDGTGAKAGDEVKFTIELNQTLPSGIIIENYTISGAENSFLIINDNLEIGTRLTISDEAYTTEGEIDSTVDDGNSEIEPGEQIGIDYRVDISSEQPLSITNLKFDLDIPSEIVSSLSADSVFVKQDRATVAPTVTLSETTYNLEFSAPLVAEPEDDGKYTTRINVYINLTANELFELTNLDEDLFVVANNLKVTNDGVETVTNNSVNKKIPIAIGEPVLSSVSYQVSGSNCVGATAIDQCKIEAGEQLTKTITLENTSSKTAAGVVLVDTFDDGGSIITSDPTDYAPTLTTADEEISGDDLDTTYYSVDDEDPTKINIMLPANSSMTIVEPLTVSETITSEQTVTNTINLSQYGNNLEYNAITKIVVTPLKLKLEIVDDEQVVEDGVITPNEAVNITLELTNLSSRATSHNDRINITPSNTGAIDKISVISIEDSNWDSVGYDDSDLPNNLQLNDTLAPGDTLTIKLRIKFGNLSGTSEENLMFTALKDGGTADGTCTEQDCTQIKFNLAVDPDYLQLARDQAADGKVIGEETYDPSLGNSQQLLNQGKDIKHAIKRIRGYFGDFKALTKELDTFTNQGNEALDTILSQINEFGLGFTSNDDEDSIVVYPYCTDNEEVSCQLFALHNKIVEKEAIAKDHFASILATIDPTNEEQLGIKPSDSGENEPTNIGADFNGYGGCVDGQAPDECEQLYPGINDRIDIQGEDVQAVEEKIEKIIGNEISEVDTDPYQADLAEINESTNQEMAEVETTNNELFGKKIDVYNENYDRVMKYVEQISKDPTYDKAIKKFKTEETTRQEVSYTILENVYNILPNTTLNGMPNRLVYSFIANPVNVSEADVNKPIETISTLNNSLLIAILAVITVLIVILLFILYWINRESIDGYK